MNQKVSSIIAIGFIIVYAFGFLFFIRRSENGISADVTISVNVSPNEKTTDKNNVPEKSCRDLCGDGKCQEIVCESAGCPCAETEQTCSDDCL